MQYGHVHRSVVNKNKVQPFEYEGWAIFRPLDREFAIYVREATAQERTSYLELFPILRLIVSGRSEEQWYGVPSDLGDKRFKVTGNVPIFLPEGLQLFDTIRTRFDGNQCWFDCLEPRRSPRIADELRGALSTLTKDPQIEGLTEEERSVYQLTLDLRIKQLEEENKDRNEERIKKALQHSGAVYRSYQERGEMYTVEYSIDGDVHRSVVNKNNLAVQSAGICLSGRDQSFDLTSLVTVIKEGKERGRTIS